MNYPIVFDRFETDFSTLGLAVLTEASGVKIKSVVNGELTMTMVYPRNGSKWPHIAADNFIQVDGQLFRIRGLEEQRDASGKLTSNIQCEHVWYDAGNCKFIPLFEQIGATPTAILEAAFADTRFVVGSVDASLANTDIVMSKTNPAAVVSQLIELVGGELVRDNWTIGLAVRCGSDQGVEFRASKNLGTVKRTTDAKAIVTRLYPYGADDLDITSVNSGLAYLDSSYISNYDYIHSGSIDYGDIEDPTELKTKALTEFSTSEKDGIDKPKITYQVDVVELAKLAGVRFETFGLGDTVRIVDSDLGIDVNARIMEYEWYPYEPKRSAVTLANFRENIGNFLVSLSDTRAQVQRMTTPEGKVKAAWMENLRAKLQTEIEAGLSKRIVSHDYGDLWVDDLDAPTKAMVIVNGVFAIANSKKENGDWDWKSFGTGDGFTADLINAGKIRLSGGLTVENDDGTFIISSTGMVMKLADESARSVFAPDAIALQVKVDGVWENAIWFDPATKKYMFDGTLSVDVINALKAEIDVVVSNTIIVNNLTAQKGYIAELTTDRHDTSDMVYRYNLQPGDHDYALRKAPVKYQRMNDEVRERVVATYAGDLEGGIENRVQCVNRAGDPLYYLDATKTGITEDATDWPVWRFVYDGPDGLGIVKEREYFDTDGTNYIPAKRHGAGNGVGDNGTMTSAKWADGYRQKYITTGAGSLAAGTEVSLGLTDDGIVLNGVVGAPALMYKTSNESAVSIDTTETTVCSMSIVLTNVAKLLIAFSSCIEAAAVLALTVKCYINGTAHPFQPVQVISAAGKHVVSFTVGKEVLPIGTVTITVIMATSTSTASVATAQGTMVVQAFPDVMPGLNNATGFTATTASDSQIDLAWSAPT